MAMIVDVWEAISVTAIAAISLGGVAFCAYRLGRKGNALTPASLALRALDAAPTPQFLVDEALRVVLMNPAFQTLAVGAGGGVTPLPLLRDVLDSAMFAQFEPAIRESFVQGRVSLKQVPIGVSDYLGTVHCVCCALPDGRRGVLVLIEELCERIQWNKARIAHSMTLVQCLIDVIPQPVYLKDAHRRIVMVNDAYCREKQVSKVDILGLSSILAVESSANACISDEEQSALADFHGNLKRLSETEDEDVFAGKFINKEECIRRLATGKVSYRIVTKGAFSYVDHEPLIVCTTFDTSPWREAEQKLEAALVRERERLERTKEYVQRLIDIIPQPLYVKDPNSNYHLVNEAFAAERGVTKESLVGKTSVKHPLAAAENNAPTTEEVRGVVLGEDAFVLAGGRIHKEECRPDHFGKERFRVVTKESCLDDSGNIVIVCAVFDVTPWRQAERNLQVALDNQNRLRDFLQSLFETTPNPIFVKNEDHCYIMANSAFARTFGRPAGEIVGLRAEDLFGQELGADIDVAEHQLFKEPPGTVHESEQSFERGGRVLHFVVSKAVSHDSEGRRAIIGVMTDFTSLRETETRWWHAKEEAEKANQAKTQFLTNMSHELRTPMHAILSFARLGEERAGNAQPDKIRHYFENIVNSGTRLLNLLNDLLDFSKLEAGHTVVEFQPCSLKNILDDVLGELSLLVKARSLHIEIFVNTSAMAWGDASKLGQVVRNIISNAIKFSPQNGSIFVRIEDCQIINQRNQDESLPAVQLCVDDEGIGVPPDELETIFDKFVQSSRSHDIPGGTGLGLTICRAIIRAHRGELFVTNREKAGASFTMRVLAATGKSEVD